MTGRQVEVAMAVLYAEAAGRSALGSGSAPPLIRHGAFAAAGPGQERRPKVVRVVEDGPLVVLHGEDSGAGEVFFAAFRFDGDRPVEQWSFSAPLAPPNRSGHSQTDGPSVPDIHQDTEASRRLVRDYFETVHLGHSQDRIDDYMDNDRQMRHEPDVQDGVSAFKHDLAKLSLDRTIDRIVLLAAQRDFVFIAAKGTHEGRPCAYLDLYRVETGKLVEHWGFPQAFPSHQSGESVNNLL